MKKKLGKLKKLNGLTLRFVPYSEVEMLETKDRIKKLLDLCLENRIIILQGRLSPDEEARLIEDTMILVGRIKGFKGIELAVVQPDMKDFSFVSKFKRGLANALVGERDVLTIIGPASVVKEIKKDPKKLEVMFRK